jgi:hypothetical protein
LRFLLQVCHERHVRQFHQENDAITQE